MDKKQKNKSLNKRLSLFDMFEIRGSSALHGYGLFATCIIRPGTPLIELFSSTPLTPLELQKIPKGICERVAMFGSKILFYTMNHSCNPNSWWNEKGGLIARRQIEEGSEITYDYSTLEFGYDWKASWECRCGELNCRKFISNEDLYNPNLYRIYKGHLPEWIASEVLQDLS